MDSILEIQNLSFSFGLKALFQGVGLRLMPLDSYAVWGPSGVGKSALLKIIAGFISGGGGIGQPLRNPPRRNNRQSGGDRPGIPGDGQTSRWTNPGNPGYTGRRQ
jgi:ABC-type multidrug transport system ATPase subunit